MGGGVWGFGSDHIDHPPSYHPPTSLPQPLAFYLTTRPQPIRLILVLWIIHSYPWIVLFMCFFLFQVITEVKELISRITFIFHDLPASAVFQFQKKSPCLRQKSAGGNCENTHTHTHRGLVNISMEKPIPMDCPWRIRRYLWIMHE